ncbi:MAG: META domain-containing protein [Pseudomonadota bacterium]
MRNGLMAALALTLAVGCAATDMEEEPMQIEGQEWRLTAFVHDDGRTEKPEGEISLQLDAAEARAFGSAGCNRFSGSYTLDGDTISFGPMAMTKRMCPPKLMANEDLFAAWLGQGGILSFENGELRYQSQAGELLRFALAPATE